MAGRGQFSQSPRPNSPFDDVLDGLSNMPLHDGRYITNSPGRLNFYGPSDEPRLNNDNPLYEIDGGMYPYPVAVNQDGPEEYGFFYENDFSTNPLYGDELHSDQMVDLGTFLRPRDARFQKSNQNTSPSPARDDMEIDELVHSWVRSPRSPAGGPEQFNSDNLPPGQDPSPNGINLGNANPGPIDPSFLQEGTDESTDVVGLASWNVNTNGPPIVRRLRIIPPSGLTHHQPPCLENRACDFSPSPSPPRALRRYSASDSISPHCVNNFAASKPPGGSGKRGRWITPSSSNTRQPPLGPPPVSRSRPYLPPVNFAVQNVKDLVAALRSDRTLFKAEARKDGSREPRLPGDHDRYFAPRKGDIIVHSIPTDDFDQKLVEYFDPQKTSQRMQPGDKLVRVKYDNQRIPDHLMITCKLYAYAPEWIYLGKALQTIKTA